MSKKPNVLTKKPGHPSFFLGFPPPDTSQIYQVVAKTRGQRNIALNGTNRGSFVGALVAWINGRWQTISFESRHEKRSAADTVKIAGTTFHFGGASKDGYVLRRARDIAVDFHSNTDVLDTSVLCRRALRILALPAEQGGRRWV